MHEQGSNIKFTGYHWPLKAFFVLYTDFESILKNLEKLIGIILLLAVTETKSYLLMKAWTKILEWRCNFNFFSEMFEEVL